MFVRVKMSLFLWKEEDEEKTGSVIVILACLVSFPFPSLGCSPAERICLDFLSSLAPSFFYGRPAS